MNLAAGDRRPGIITGVTDDGLPVVVPFEGKCTPLVAGERRVGLITGIADDGTPIVAWSYQKCKAGTSSFEAGKRYIGLITGIDDDGTPIIGSWCEPCDDTSVTICSCEICCTLNATVAVGSAGDSKAWTDDVNVEMACHGVLETDGGHCCINDEVEDDTFCFKIRNTYAEKDTIGSPEAYIGAGPSSGTREVKTVIWSSGNFEIEGETYRLSYWISEGTIYQTSPSTVTTPFCIRGWSLQHLHTDHDIFDPYPDWWETVAGTDIATWVAANNYQWFFNLTDDNPYAPDDCPPGYSYNAGELIPFPRCPYDLDGTPVTGGSITQTNDCPVYLFHESWTRLAVDPNDCEHKDKCARVTITDGCVEFTPCVYLETVLGGATINLDWEVASCHAASGSVAYAGEACSEFALFNAGTANIFPGADTTFDDEDVGGPDIVFQWCDGELTKWYDAGPGEYGLIEFALCCMEREDGSTYLALYALLTLVCAGGVTQWAYKSRDLSVVTIDGETVVSVTGLTPFATQSSGSGCTCDPPALNLALRVRPAGSCP